MALRKEKFCKTCKNVLKQDNIYKHNSVLGTANMFNLQLKYNF